MLKDWRIWSIMAGSVMLWIAIAVILVYDHNIELRNPSLTDAERQAHAQVLYLIAGAFVAFNAFMTVLRVRMVLRAANRQQELHGS